MDGVLLADFNKGKGGAGEEVGNDSCMFRNDDNNDKYENS